MDSRFKFRAWNKIEGIMYSYALFRRDDYAFAGNGMGVYCFLLENLDLMQCTGLTDKFGRDIYEGDIVDFDGEYYKIEFADGCFWLNQKYDSIELHKAVGKIDKVIGNIYEDITVTSDYFKGGEKDD